MSAAAGLAVADELSLEIGGSPARGAIALRVLPQARLDLALAAGRLDLDAWLPVLLRGAQPGSPWPGGIPTGIDLSAEAATFAGGTLRRLRGAFDLDEDGLVVRDAAALLPGDAQLTLSGRVPRSGRAGAFEGTAHLAAPDLRATLRWLEPLAPGAVAALPPGVLRTADLSARVSVEAGQASLSEMTGALDGDRMTGGLSLRLGPRLGLGAGLSFERLALDAWLPDVSALGSLEGLQQALGHGAAFDADVHVEARKASWRGAALGQLVLDAQAEATRLTLRRLEAAPPGMRVTASGTVAEGGRVTEGRLELSSQDIAPLRALLPADPPWLPGLPGLLRGPGTGLLLLSGPPEALAARLNVEFADLRIEAQPIFNVPGRRWAGPVTLHHPGAPRLLEALGAPGAAAWLGDGSMSLICQISVTPGRVELDNFALVAGSFRGAGQLAAEGGAVSGQIAAEALPLPLPSASSPEPLPVQALRGWQATVRLDAAQVLLGSSPAAQGLSAVVDLRNGALRILRASAKLERGTFEGAAVFDAASDPPRLAVQAAAAGATLSGPVLGAPLDVISGRADATLDLTATGHSPAALLATLAGTASLTVRDGVAVGFDLPGAAAALADTDRSRVLAGARAALLDGTTPFTRLDLPLQVRRGALSTAAQLAGPGGSATLAGTIDLQGRAADLRLALRPDAPDPPAPDQRASDQRASDHRAPELGVRLTGPAAKLVRTPELASLARWLAERAPQ